MRAALLAAKIEAELTVQEDVHGHDVPADKEKVSPTLASTISVKVARCRRAKRWR